MAKKQNTFEKRRREIEKKQKAQEKRGKRQNKKDVSPDDQEDAPVAARRLLSARPLLSDQPAPPPAPVTKGRLPRPPIKKSS